MLSYTMAGMQNDPAGRAIVDRVRDVAVPAALASAPDARAYITGPVATALDTARFYGDGMPLVFLFVLGLSFLLLLVAFRSIIIPLQAILLNLGSTAAAYGVLVFQEGWLGSQMGSDRGSSSPSSRCSSSPSSSGSPWTTMSSS
jgi:putative drug exporter of the RND superfamily